MARLPRAQSNRKRLTMKFILRRPNLGRKRFAGGRASDGHDRAHVMRTAGAVVGRDRRCREWQCPVQAWGEMVVSVSVPSGHYTEAGM